MAMCEVCGKTIGSAGLRIEPCKEIPDIKRTVCFCSNRCANVFLGRIKAKYKKQRNNAVRKELELADRKPSNDDLVAIYQTLTAKEKMIMFLVAMEAAYFSNLKLKDFYKNLNALEKKQ